MKRCSYCGGEYPDEAVLCTIDHTVLGSDTPIPVLSKPESRVLEQAKTEQNQETENVPKSEDFRYLWRIDPSEATEVLKEFLDTGVRFRVEQAMVSQQMEKFLGYPPMPKLDIYVHWDDMERAMKILPADWNV